METTQGDDDTNPVLENLQGDNNTNAAETPQGNNDTNGPHETPQGDNDIGAAGNSKGEDDTDAALETTQGNNAIHAALQTITSGPRGARDAIDALLPRLSALELFYLRHRARNFNPGTANGEPLKTCVDMPPEILTLIAEFLDLHDLLTLRRVSRAWQLTWMRGAVLRGVLPPHFPGLVQLHPEDVDLQPVLLETINLSRCRRQSKCHSAAVPWDIDDALSDLPPDGHTSVALSNPPEPVVGRRLPYRQLEYFDGQHHQFVNLDKPTSLYCDGRMVWQPAFGKLVIDDLRAGRRVLLATRPDPRRHIGVDTPVALSEKLIVLATSRAIHDVGGPMQPVVLFRNIRVYHLDHKAWKDIAPPATVASCHARNETLVVSCHDRHSYVWSWGGGLELLPTDHPTYNARPELYSEDRHAGVPRAIFHPTDQDVVFLVWLYSHGPLHKWTDWSITLRPRLRRPLYTSVVVRYERGPSRSWTASERFHHTMDCPWFDRIQHYEDAQRQRVNLAVLESPLLGSLHLDLALTCTAADNHGSWTITTCRIDGRQYEAPIWGPIELAQSFNVLTGKFSVLFCHRIFHDTPRVLSQVHIWNGKVFETYPSRSLEHGLDGLTIECRYFDRTRSLSDGATKYEYRSAQEPGYADTFRIRGQFSLYPQKLFVDDDFMIVAALQGYSVHAFHADGANTWLFRSKEDDVGTFPETVLDNFSTLGRPRAMELAKSTEHVVFQSPNPQYIGSPQVQED